MSLLYQPRARLTDPTWFYGRKDDLRRLFSYLDKDAPQNVSILGQRRIGKSWLLCAIAQDENLRAEYLSAPEQYTFVYWDLQAERHLDPDSFFKRLIDLILASLPRDLAAACGEEINQDDLEDSVWEMVNLLEAADHHVVLLLDEFDVIMGKTAFAEGFFSHMRSLFGLHSLACVIASYHRLRDICNLANDSPFFNIFSQLQLGLLPDREAEAFVTEPFQAENIAVDDACVRRILCLTGHHPCFISQFCHSLYYEVHTTGQLTTADVDRLSAVFQQNVEDDFSYYLDHLDQDERALLLNIAEGNLPSSAQNPVYVRLQGKSLVQERSGRPELFSSAFSQFARKHQDSDVYFERAFSDSELGGPSFVRLCDTVLKSATHIPDPVRANLQSAIQAIRARPHEAMRTCGRDVLSPLIDLAYQGELGGRWNGDQLTACQQFADMAERRAFPMHLAQHFHAIRISGNHGSHDYEYDRACTPARAFLTVLETIHLAEQVYTRY